MLIQINGLMSQPAKKMTIMMMMMMKGDRER